MVRAVLALALASGLGLGLTAPAHADVFRLFGDVHGGGLYGQGTSGAQKDTAFFKNAPHAAYGAQVGAEVLFADLWIEHDQFTTGSRLTTWTQIGLGVHFQLALGSTKEQKADTGAFVELSSGLFFGVGTGQQVMPPLDNAQISDKGFLLGATLGAGTHLTKNFDLALSIPVSWGYFFKQGAANDTTNHYQSVQVEAFVVLRAHVGLF